MSTEKQDGTETHLLEEYKLTQDYVTHLNQTIWQLGGIFIAASIAAFAYVSQAETIQKAGLFIVGTVSMLSMLTWYLMMKRLSFFVTVSYYRMREIEGSLGFWRNRYIHHLDLLKNKQTPQAQTNQESKDAQERLHLLEQSLAHKTKYLVPVQTLALCLLILIVVMWAILFVYSL